MNNDFLLGMVVGQYNASSGTSSTDNFQTFSDALIFEQLSMSDSVTVVLN